MAQISGRFDGNKAVKGLTRAEGKPQDPTMPKKQKYTKKYNTWRTGDGRPTGQDIQEMGEFDAKGAAQRRGNTPYTGKRPWENRERAPMRDVYPKDEL